MILTDKQAHWLVQILQDTLKLNVVGYLTTTTKYRVQLLNEILNQQSNEPIEMREN